MRPYGAASDNYTRQQPIAYFAPNNQGQPSGEPCYILQQEDVYQRVVPMDMQSQNQASALQDNTPSFYLEQWFRNQSQPTNV